METIEKQEPVNEDEFTQYEYVEDMEYEGADLADALVEVKVSADGGMTWARREINLGGEVDESGLERGEIFQVNGEKYRVVEADFGLTIEPLKKPVSEKKSAKKSKR